MNQQPPNQDGQIEGHVIHPEKVPSYLPKELTEAILASDVTILIASSDEQEQKLTVRQVYASGLPEPEYIASHAYATAIHDQHQNLLRMVRGEPTDALRYQALRDFAVLAYTDPARFEAVNAMLERFEDTTLEGDAVGEIAANHDTMADFLIQALLETAPPVAAQQPSPDH